MGRISNEKAPQKNKNIRSFGGVVLCIALSIAVLAAAMAPAYAVRISLKRIIFDGKKRSEILTLINNSAKPQTYRLGWRKFRMSETASLHSIEEGEDDSDILWADDMIRFAPRRVTVPPGSTQQIRLLFRRPADLQEAEYRSHLWVVTESAQSSFNPDPGQKERSVKLSVQPAISLPIFVRHGNLTAEASITAPALTKTAEGLNVAFILNRTGTRSIYGDFDFVCADPGTNTILSQIRGIAVYTETERRILDFDVPLSEETMTSCNSVKIVFRSDPNDPDFAGQTLAEATASLN